MALAARARRDWAAGIRPPCGRGPTGLGRWVWLALTSPASLVAEVLETFVERPLVRILDPEDIRVFLSKREDARES